VAPDAIDHGRELDLPGGPDAALLLHGLTGSTFELFPIAERLRARGVRVLAPLLAGHGGAAQDLAGVPWTEWLAKAGRDLGRLEGARRTLVVGCSTGALLGCALAAELPSRVQGLVLLAPALELALAGRLAALLGRLPFLRERIVSKGSGSDVSDPEMRRRNRGLDGVPLSSVSELASLAAHVERLLPVVEAPALVIHGGHDHTVTAAGARRLAQGLGSGPAEVVVLPRSFHLVGIDVERERCAELAAGFLDSLPLQGSSPAADPAPSARESGHRPPR
jgi:carboxylesterase